jgi:hypothetical protein
MDSASDWPLGQPLSTSSAATTRLRSMATATSLPAPPPAPLVVEGVMVGWQDVGPGAGWSNDLGNRQHQARRSSPAQLRQRRVHRARNLLLGSWSKEAIKAWRAKASSMGRRSPFPTASML